MDPGVEVVTLDEHGDEREVVAAAARGNNIHWATVAHSVSLPYYWMVFAANANAA
jgi:hypothetical protein